MTGPARAVADGERIATPAIRCLALLVLMGCADEPANAGSSSSDVAATADAVTDVGAATDTSSGADTEPDPADAGCANGAPCEDGEPCTVGDRCVDGSCKAGLDACDCRADPDCAAFEDGDRCNGTLRCATAKLPYRCVLDPTTIVTCPADADTDCKSSRCNPLNGKCWMAPSPDGTLCDDGQDCTVSSACKAGTCTAGQNSWCDCQTTADCAGFEDGDPCNGTLYCDVSNFPFRCRVAKATVVKCAADKDTACKRNRCAKDTGKCAMTDEPTGTPCDDGKPETLSDVCAAGLCAGTKVKNCATDGDCAKWEDGDLCNGKLFCDKSANLCALNPATVVTCPTVHDTACRQSTCEASTGACSLLAQPNGKPCEDGDACTKGDICFAGKCDPGTFVCTCTSDADCKDDDDGDLCNGVFFCNKSTKKCEHNPSSAVLCPTVNDTACAKNACDPLKGQCTVTPTGRAKLRCDVANAPCRYVVKPAAAATATVACDDGDPCTTATICQGKTCGGGNKVCACASDADCPDIDGDLCNGTRYCDKAVMHAVCKDNPATAVVCSKKDDWACEANTCNKATGGCQMKPRNDGNACQDGEVCTLKDACKAGACVPGKPDPCEDGDSCTEDKCVAGKGCAHTAVSCDDGNACTTEKCDAKSGQCTKPAAVAEGGLCNADNNPCTVGDACIKGVCKVGGPADCAVPGKPCKVGKCHKLSAVSYQCVAVNRADGTACPEGDKGCAVGATCKAGKCVPGTTSRYGDRNYRWAGTQQSWFEDVMPAADGFVAVGGEAYGDPKAPETRWMAMRYDRAGRPMWAAPSRYKGPGTSAHQYATAIYARSDGPLMIAGAAVDAKGALRPTLIERTATGKPGLERRYDYGDGRVRGRALAYDRNHQGWAVIAGYSWTDNKGADQLPGLRRIKTLLDPGPALTAPVSKLAGGAYTDVRIAADGSVLAALRNGGPDGAPPGGGARVYLVAWDATDKHRFTSELYRPETKVLHTATIRTLSDTAEVVFGFTGVTGGNRTRRALVRLSDGYQLRSWEFGFVTERAAVTEGSHAIYVGNVSSMHRGRLTVADADGNEVAFANPAPPKNHDDQQMRGVAVLSSGDIAAVGFAAAKDVRIAAVHLVSPWLDYSCAHAGQCWGKRLKDCDDGKPCTLDRCHSSFGCLADKPLAMRCAPGTSCAETASCQAGKCVDDRVGKLGQRLDPHVRVTLGAARHPSGRLARIGVSAAGGAVPLEFGLSVYPTTTCGLVQPVGAAVHGSRYVAYGADAKGRAVFCTALAFDAKGSPERLHVHDGNGGKGGQRGFGAAAAAAGQWWHLYDGPRRDGRDISLVRVVRATGAILDDQPLMAAGKIEHGHAVRKAANTGAWVVGSVDNKDRDALLIRVNAVGKVVWHKAYDDGGLAETFYDVAETSLGGVMAAGTRVYDTGLASSWAVRIGSGGQKLWAHGKPEPDRITWSAVRTDGLNHFVLAGNVTTDTLDYVYMRRVNGPGQAAWTAAVKSPEVGRHTSLRPGGLQLLDGTWWLTGRTTLNNKTGGWHARLSRWGHGDCYQAGACVDKAFDACDDVNACTADRCAAATGKCLHTPLSGVTCGTDRTCKAGICTK